jgi:eukaryotic-like serine/threonine-protein kinase
VIGRTLAHYRVVRKLGSGGMGEVYLAHDTVLGRSVALKVLSSTSSTSLDRIQRFVGEARAASVLNHPNIATIHELGEADDLRFIVMQYVVGETLKARLAGGPLRPGHRQYQRADRRRTGGCARRRDHPSRYQPSNVIITPRGHAVVLDFGVAKRVSFPEPTSEDHTVEPTHTGVVMGTVQYMSPEQALGRPVDFRSDIFSLGVVLYEMATGRLPFSGSTPTRPSTLSSIAHRKASCR